MVAWLPVNSPSWALVALRGHRVSPDGCGCITVMRLFLSDVISLLYDLQMVQQYGPSGVGTNDSCNPVFIPTQSICVRVPGEWSWA